VGSAAIQIAKLFHCRVLTTAGSESKLAKARALGADEGIPYHEQDFAAETLRLTGKAGVDVVIEHIGGEVFEKSLTCIRKGGRLVTCGNTVGPKATISTAHLFGKHLDVLGSFMGEKQELIDVLKFLASGQLKAVVDREFPLEQAADAHRHLAGRDIFGKVILRMDLS
jgi:NADPH:quinone reductase-like Zn-dependent oxidoreductase